MPSKASSSSRGRAGRNLWHGRATRARRQSQGRLDHGRGRRRLGAAAPRAACDSGAGLLVLGATSDLPARLAVTRAKAPQEPPTVLALASLPDPEELAGLLAAGVDGLLLRSTGVAELADALELLRGGERAVAPALLPLLVGVIGLAAVGPGEPLLTEKEREVLARLAEGGSNRAIAEALSVSPATVKTHLAHIYEKLGASDRRDALVRAIALGILR